MKWCLGTDFRELKKEFGLVPILTNAPTPLKKERKSTATSWV